MFLNKSILTILAAFAAVTLITSCFDNEVEKTQAKSALLQPVVLDVYKSPTCGCCKNWIRHIEENGFQSKIHNQSDLSVLKSSKHIAPQHRSCHTAVSQDGFIFEGHVPAKFIQQFLTEKHPSNVIGLAVPAMPLGSPGMEVGDKFQPYRVLLLKSDGSYVTYSNVQSYEEQF